MNAKPAVVCFKLFPGKDDDLIEFLKSLGSREKSSYIRLAIRQYFIAGANTSNFRYHARPPLQPVPELTIEQPGEPSGNPGPAVPSDEELAARLDRW